MDWRTITVDTEVDIYIKDIKDEVLKKLDNEEECEFCSRHCENLNEMCIRRLMYKRIMEKE